MTIKKNQSAPVETIGNPKSYEGFEASMKIANRQTSSELSEQLRKKFPKWSAKWHLLNGFAALKHGSTIYVIIRRHSRTGYSKNVSLYTFVNDSKYITETKKDGIAVATLTYHIGKLLGYNVHNFEGRDIIRVDDYPQELVAHISEALFDGKPSELNCEVL